MNKLSGSIKEIHEQGSLAIIDLEAGSISLKAIIINPDAQFVKGAKVEILFKETEVLIGTGDCSHLSAQNQIHGQISSLEKDALLSRLELNTPVGNIVAIITTAAVERLSLKTGDAVTALIKTNEIMVSH